MKVSTLTIIKCMVAGGAKAVIVQVLKNNNYKIRTEDGKTIKVHVKKISSSTKAIESEKKAQAKKNVPHKQTAKPAQANKIIQRKCLHSIIMFTFNNLPDH